MLVEQQYKELNHTFTLVTSHKSLNIAAPAAATSSCVHQQTVYLSLKMVSSSSSITSVMFSFLFMIFVVQIIEVAPTTTVRLPPNVRVPAVIVFRDSIVDPGNNNHLATLARCNFAPYGRDSWVEINQLEVESLGIKSYLPAYLDPSVSPNELLTGVSFVSGGAGYDTLTAKIVGVLGLEAQLELFKQYMEKVKAIGGEEKARSILSESLYLIVCGSDDIANTYFTSPFRKPHYDVPAYTDLMVQSASTLFQELNGLGAPKFGILSAPPPIGCLPSQRTLAGRRERACAADYNHAAQLFNSKLSSELDNLNRKLPQSRFVYIDIYNPFSDVINNPGHYGFKEVSKGCCGTGGLETAVLCDELNPFTCKDVSKYVFWDSFHPTEKSLPATLWSHCQ